MKHTFDDTDHKHLSTLLQLLKEKAYKYGNFTLSSGKPSEHYVNCKPVTLSCEGNALLSHLILKCIDDDAVAVGGLTLGADPLVCGVAQRAYNSLEHWRSVDALIVRKYTKGYGTRETIEGPKPPKGSVVTVLDDVCTTGSSAMYAVVRLREEGYIVKRVVAIVDRMEDTTVWDDNDIEFLSLFTQNDLTDGN